MVLFLNSDLHQKIMITKCYVFTFTTNRSTLYFIFSLLLFFYVRFLWVLSFVWCFSVLLHFIEQHYIINGTRHLQIDIQFVSKRFSIIFFLLVFGMIYVGPCVIHRRLTNHHHY